MYVQDDPLVFHLMTAAILDGTGSPAKPASFALGRLGGGRCARVCSGIDGAAVYRARERGGGCILAASFSAEIVLLHLHMLEAVAQGI
jgi:hypothetical protein